MPDATDGKWLGTVNSPGDRSTFGDGLGVYGVHGALLRTGRVILFSGRVESSAYLYRSWTWDATSFSEGDTALSGVEGRWFLPEFDAGGTDASPPGPAPTWADDNNVDLFCAHHVMLEDGRLLVMGGAGGIAEGDAAGNRAIFTYDPGREKWKKEPQFLQKGRWYPTAVNLHDGRVAVISGRTASGSGQEQVSEVLSPPDFSATVIAGGDKRLYIYPGLVMVPGGRVFYLPTNWLIETQNASTAVGIINPTVALQMTGPSTGTWIDFPTVADPSVKVAPINPWREEGTFVLLPPAQAGRILMIGGGYATDALASSGTQRSEANIDHCEILETQGATPRWIEAGNLNYGRVNVSAVLLPDSKVLIVGGHDSTKRNSSHNDRLIAELYDPTVAFNPADPTAAFTEVAQMGHSRNYHSCLLLLPDGRVLVAGGEDSPHEGGNQTSVEIYAPPYCYQGARPGIDPIDHPDAPAGEISYGGSFAIRCETTAQAQDVGEVVLMRPGAMTHHTDTEQRHVPLSFSYVGGTDLHATAVIDPTVAPPGYYMLFVVDAQGKPCKEARWVRLSHRRCRLITDRSTFSVEELEAIPSRAVADAIYVHIEGFLPSELGITTATPTATQLDAWSPDITFWDGATQITVVRASATQFLPEDPTLPPGVRQRFTFKYTLHVDDMSVFPAVGATVERRTLGLRTDRSGWRCYGRIHLMRQPDPYVLDGPTHWLSTDLRVFKLRAGQSRFGVTLNASDPIGFLRAVLTQFDADSNLAGHPFTTITEEQAASMLQIAETEGGTQVFNFAICRVRYRATVTTAPNVRMHFRMFTTSATNLNYNPTTTYRSVASGGSNIALPGIGAGNEVVTIPFFGRERVDLSTNAFTDQVDDTNLKTLPVGGGAETRRYFGALLDFNLPASKLPQTLIQTATGPFATGDLSPVADLIRGRHQCLVAEVDFAVDPIDLNDSPANSDNLAQRNLAIEGSDNPGGADSHTIALTFDIDPTWGVREAQKLAGIPGLNTTRAPVVAMTDGHMARGEDGEAATEHAADPEFAMRTADPRLFHSPPHPPAPLFVADFRALGDRGLALDALLGADPIGARFAPAHHEHKSPPLFNWFEPDELMIDWGELPTGTTASLYMPGIPSQQVLRAAQLRPTWPRMEAIDDHTLRLTVNGVSYIPLPTLARTRLAGLLSVTLPPSVQVGQRFNVTVRQLSFSQRVVVGTFELSIPVSTGADLLVEDSRWYAVLQHIALNLPSGSRWQPVLARLLRVVAGRIEGFGGDPAKIPPTLNPADITEPGDRNHPDPCEPPPDEEVCPPADEPEPCDPPPHDYDCTDDEPDRGNDDKECDEEDILCRLLIKKYLAKRGKH